MSQGLLLIDGNSLGHAAHNAPRLTSGDMPTQAIFGMVRSIKGLAETYPGWNQLVLWDGATRWRQAVMPEYKANRVAKDERSQVMKDDYKRQSPFVRKALQLLGIRQALALCLEADDLAGIIVKRSSPTTNIVAVSGDQDWLQFVRPNVMWFDPIAGRNQRVGLGNFTEFTGYFSPQEFVEGKALRGDTSDNIPGVGGLGEVRAAEFMAQFKSVANFFAQCDSGAFVPKKKAHQGLASPAGRAAFALNMRLMNLLDVAPPPKEEMINIAPTYNELAFRALCEKLAFMSITRNFDTFMAPFRALQPQLPKAA